MLPLRPGDHLVSPRVGYQHHGIYIGQQQVIHYQGLFGGNEANRVVQGSLREFSQGNAVQVRAHPSRRFSGKKSAERALARLGEHDYHLLFNNCEHFVMWCIEGESASPQVRHAVVSTTATTAASATAQVLQATLGNAATTTAGLVASSLTASASGSATTATVASLVGITSAPILTPLVVGVAAAYGAAKLWDWLTD